MPGSLHGWVQCVECGDWNPPGDLEPAGLCRGWCVTCSAAKAFAVNDGWEEAVTDYSSVRVTLERLNDPAARWEMGEDARRAQLAALADAHLLDLINANERLYAVLCPRAVESQETPAA